ncbi:histidine kinase, partial [Acinetobacter baumannii]
NLQGLIAIDPARAQHMLTQLIIYLRATLSTSRAEQTSLKQEFALIQAYLELLAIRMGKRLQYTLTLPDELQQAGIAPMLLQPLVENAI